MLPMALARSSSGGVAIMLCASVFVDDVMLAHNRQRKGDNSCPIAERHLINYAYKRNIHCFDR